MSDIDDNSSDSEKSSKADKSSNVKKTGKVIKETVSSMVDVALGRKPKSNMKEKGPSVEKPKRKPAKFMEHNDKRLDHVKKRMVTLQKSVADLLTLMGDEGQAFLKVAYKSVRKQFEWTAGKDFQSSNTSESQLVRTVKEAIQESMKPVLQIMQKVPLATFEQVPESSQSLAIYSPSKKARKSKTPFKASAAQRCGICLKHKVTYHGPWFETGWIGCTHRVEGAKSTGKKHNFPGQPCVVWAHTDCLGFVGLTDEDAIAALPDWYCNLHRPAARAHKGVESDYLQTTDPDYASTDSD